MAVDELTERKREAIPLALRWAVWERDDFRCRRCGTRRFLTVDHVLAVVNGGTENLQTLCLFCNSRKGDGPDLPPVDADQIAALLERAALIKEWLDDTRMDLYDSVQQSYEAGASLRVIAEAVGLSKPRIHQIVRGIGRAP